MIQIMIKLGWRQWILVVGFVLTAGITALFAFHAVHHMVYWRLHADEPIRPWMSVPHVAHSYHLPPEVLYQALGMQRRPHDRRPLREIASERELSTNDVIVTLQRAIAQDRAHQLPPPARSPEGEKHP